MKHSNSKSLPTLSEMQIGYVYILSFKPLFTLANNNGSLFTLWCK